MAKIRNKPTQPRRPFYDEPGYISRNPYLPRAIEEFPGRIIAPLVATERIGQWGPWANGRPIHVEIGPGKGKFITDHALANPEAVVIAVEMKFRRVYKVAKRLATNGADNGYLLRFDGNFLNWIFGENELDQLFLYFPDPWWKKERQRFRHIISADFLESVHHMLKPGGFFDIKTDHEQRFDMIMDQLEKSPLSIVHHTRDLANSPYAEGNIETIFETKFREQGLPAYYVRVTKKSAS